VLDTSGNVVFFDGGGLNTKINDDNMKKFKKSRVTKIYRKSYRVPLPGDYQYNPDDFYNRFMFQYSVDRSGEYDYPKFSVSFSDTQIQVNAINQSPVYLCSFGYGFNYVPFTVSLPSENNYIYKNLSCSTIVFPATHLNGQMFPLGDAFYFGMGIR
jgi:hypothetical protein